MAASTVSPLRPLSFGELLDRAIRLYRRNLLNFVGIIAIVQIPLVLLSLLVSLGTMGDTVVRLQDPAAVRYDNPLALIDTKYYVGLGASTLLSIVSFVLLQGVATAALTRSIADHYLGRPISFADAYIKIGKSWGRLVGAILLALLILIGLVIWWLLVPCIGWLTGLGLLAFFSSAIVPLIPPIIVLEGKRVGETLRRAWDLARRRFWWVVGLVAVLILFAQVVVTGPTYLLSTGLEFIINNISKTTDAYMTLALKTIGQSLLSMIFGLLYTPLQLTCLTLMYFDLRVRTEGFDMALLASSAAGENVDPIEAAAQTTTQNTLPLVNWQDVGYFVLLSIAIGGIWMVLITILGMIGIGASNLLF